MFWGWGAPDRNDCNNNTSIGKEVYVSILHDAETIHRRNLRYRRAVSSNANSSGDEAFLSDKSEDVDDFSKSQCTMTATTTSSNMADDSEYDSILVPYFSNDGECCEANGEVEVYQKVILTVERKGGTVSLSRLPQEQNSDSSSSSSSSEEEFELVPTKSSKHLIEDKSSTRRKAAITKVVLNKDDEIHASPCQCALSLMGLHGIFPMTTNQSHSQSSSSPARNKTFESGVMRTQSGKAQILERPTTTTTTTLSPSSCKSHRKMLSIESIDPCLKLGGPPPRDHHEITLIKKPVPFDHDRYLNGDETTIPWRAVTIRCDNHDDMDGIIGALKASSNAKVVPFSSNPKSKLLKKNRKNTIRWPPRISKRPKCHPLPTTTEATATINESPPYKEDKDRWNKRDKCELCGLTFTLLTRRHHCRKCDRSCCGDCSCLMVKEGGQETRFCNRCDAKSVRHRLSSRKRHMSGGGAGIGGHYYGPPMCIPGIVHEECASLGVGVSGQLPHWRNFTHWSYFLSVTEPEERKMRKQVRPAVGRLTIEVMEALALPAIDLNGKCDPYVRATITGYDRNLKWQLNEWLPSNRYSLCTHHCGATLSPVWRGRGLLGGESLTLPIISTAGAVLRLEILHYDIMTNAKGKDRVLRIVEIPLADIPNANNQPPGGTETDGFVDRWYRMNPPQLSDDHLTSRSSLLARPIPNPQCASDDASKSDHCQSKKIKLSWQEIIKRTECWCIAPIEWIAQALNIDVPRHPGSNRSSAIHVRLKLNASEYGDLLSHSWLPPVKLLPEIPPFDPDTLLSLIIRIHKKIKPYLDLFEFCEEVIKWKHPVKICITSYLVVAFHIVFAKHFLVLVHLYIIAFLCKRIHYMKSKPEGASNSCGSLHPDQDRLNSSFSCEDYSVNENADSIVGMQVTIPPDEDTNNYDLTSSNQTTPNLNQTPSNLTSDEEEENSNGNGNDTARLNKFVYWLAKKMGEDKGLDTLQHKLGGFEKDVINFNSLWDGTCIVKTYVTIGVVILSGILHCLISRRLFWLLVSGGWYFGQSPGFVRLVRTIWGLHHGFAQVIRRRHLWGEEEEFILGKL